MYSKVKILGHPVHPMLVAYPIAFYTSTLIAYLVFVTVSSGDYFWMKLAIAANVAGVIMAVVAALPGFVDWATGIPSGTAAKRHGTIHLSLNLTALVLFAINAVAHLDKWSPTIHPHTGIGIVLSLLGVGCTIAAGYFGWTMVQTDGVGVDLAADHESRLNPAGA
jgi:uncharacterized membrane protein